MGREHYRCTSGHIISYTRQGLHVREKVWIISILGGTFVPGCLVESWVQLKVSTTCILSLSQWCHNLWLCYLNMTLVCSYLQQNMPQPMALSLPSHKHVWSYFWVQFTCDHLVLAPSCKEAQLNLKLPTPCLALCPIYSPSDVNKKTWQLIRETPFASWDILWYLLGLNNVWIDSL